MPSIRAVLPWVVVAALLSPSAGAQTPGDRRGADQKGLARRAEHPDHPDLVVWLTSAPRVASLGQTGLEEFDALCSQLGATRLAPLSPTQARHARPAAFRSLGLDRVVRLRLGHDSDVADVDDAVRRLGACRDVERACEPGRVEAAKSPNDPQFPSQWPLQSDKIAATGAWDLATDATGVVIAVIDSGADLQHADFKTNRWINAGEVAGNGIDDDGNGFVDDRFGYDFVNDDGDPDDDFGHGTEVSGVLAAVGDNSLDITGVCWVAEVMSCKVLSSAGSGNFGDVAAAVIYATDNGARVSNMSIVATTDDATLRAAIDYARDADVVQVAAAGNTGDQIVQYPASYDGVIAVIATDENDARWNSSTFGIWCDVSAPGVNILTLRNNGGTIHRSGTSYASPHVAGVAALVRKLQPDLDRIAVELTIEQSSDDLGPAGFDADFGWGRLNAELALQKAVSLRSTAPVVDDGSSVDLQLSVPSEPGFLYVLLPTTLDREPGIALSSYDPADARFLPLNDDWLQGWVLSTVTNPLFQQFISNLDAGGAATATFLVPKHLWQGVDFDFAFVTLDPADLAHLVLVSEPCRVHVQ